LGAPGSVGIADAVRACIDDLAGLKEVKHLLLVVGQGPLRFVNVDIAPWRRPIDRLRTPLIGPGVEDEAAAS
jgi:hypothetical protein